MKKIILLFFLSIFLIVLSCDLETDKEKKTHHLDKKSDFLENSDLSKMPPLKEVIAYDNEITIAGTNIEKSLTIGEYSFGLKLNAGLNNRNLSSNENYIIQYLKESLIDNIQFKNLNNPFDDQIDHIIITGYKNYYYDTNKTEIAYTEYYELDKYFYFRQYQDSNQNVFLMSNNWKYSYKQYHSSKDNIPNIMYSMHENDAMGYTNYAVTHVHFEEGTSSDHHFADFEFDPFIRYRNIIDAITNITGTIKIGRYGTRTLAQGISEGRITLLDGYVVEKQHYSQTANETTIPVSFSNNHITLRFYTEDWEDFDYNDSYITITIEKGFEQSNTNTLPINLFSVGTPNPPTVNIESIRVNNNQSQTSALTSEIIRARVTGNYLGNSANGRIITITCGESLLYLRGEGTVFIAMPNTAGNTPLTATVTGAGVTATNTTYVNVSKRSPYIALNLSASSTNIFTGNSISLTPSPIGSQTTISWYVRVNNGEFKPISGWQNRSPSQTFTATHNSTGHYAYCANINNLSWASSPIITVTVRNLNNVLQSSAIIIDKFNQLGNYVSYDANGNMPNLGFNLHNPEPNSSVSWNLSIRYDNNRGGQAPSFLDQSDFNSGNPGYVDPFVYWRPTLNGMSIGGNATITATYYLNGSTHQLQKTFTIRGQNPPVSTVKNSIGNSSTDRRIFRAIVQHESSYRQFNANHQQYAGEPNYGYSNGWGITQLDPPSQNKNANDNANESRENRWNWQKNLQEGFNRYNNKYTDFACKWQRILEANYAHNNNGASFPYPSALKVKQATGISYSMPDDVNTVQKIYQIQAYNGVALNYFIRNQTEQSLTDCRGNIIMPGARWYTCWDYHTNTDVWFFHANQNNYVQKINNVYQQAQNNN